MSDVLPEQFLINQGLAISKKGHVDGKQFHTWEIIHTCTSNRCPAVSVCPYEKGDHVKCGVQVEYLSSITELIIKNFGKELSETELYRIGMHLIPMYNVLCKIKIALAGNWDVVLTSAKGNVTVHPLMKEFREQVKAIENTWKSIGIAKPNIIDPPLGSGQYSKGNYYEEMEKAAQSGRGLKLKRRKSR